MQHVQATLDSCVITRQLRVAFDEALNLIGSALAEDRPKAGYLHGSFGSGKSHFMAVVHALLSAGRAVRAGLMAAAVFMIALVPLMACSSHRRGLRAPVGRAVRPCRTEPLGQHRCREQENRAT